MPLRTEAEHLTTAAASLGDKLSARWALIVMIADRRTETEARAIAAQAVRDLALTEEHEPERLAA